MANDIHSKVQRIGFLKQVDTTNQWAAPNAASANFKTSLGVPTSVIPTPSVRVQTPDFTSSAGVMPEQGRVFIDTIGELPSIKYSSYACTEEIPHYFAAALQGFAQGAATGYVKTIYPANDPDMDFAANEGILYTIAQRNYDSGSVGDGRLLTNALLREFVFKHAGNATGLERQTMVDLDWVGLTMTPDQHFTGTWVAQPTISTDFAKGYLTLIAGALTFTGICYRNFEMRVSNTIEIPCKTETGLASNYRLANQSVSFIIDIPYTSATYPVFSSFMAGDVFQVNWALGASNVALGIDFNVCHLTENPYVYDGDYVALRLNLMVAKPTAGFASTPTTDTVTIEDDTDIGY